MSPDSLQSCLSAVCVWSDHWQLVLSPLKCSVIHITSGSTRNLCPNFVYRIGQSILPCVSCQSDLGVSYNNKLKLKLAKPRFCVIVMEIVFQFVINSWNSLPDKIVSSSSVMGFKAGVSKLQFCGYCSC